MWHAEMGLERSVRARREPRVVPVAVLARQLLIVHRPALIARLLAEQYGHRSAHAGDG